LRVQHAKEAAGEKDKYDEEERTTRTTSHLVYP
jgi:hypothetical protein